MDDYLSEKEQWEAIKVWLRENGLWLIAGVLIASAILGSLRWYQDHSDKVAAEAGAEYFKMLKALDAGDRTQALVILGSLERDYSPSPYVDQAKLTAARVYVDSNELDKAAGELQSVADHSKDAELSLIARLRLARVQIAQQKPDVALATLDSLKPGAFAATYHEVRGDAYYAKGDKPTALKEYLSAKVGDFGAAAESQQLDLKISDLSAEGKPAAPAPTAAAAANPAAK